MTAGLIGAAPFSASGQLTISSSPQVLAFPQPDEDSPISPLKMLGVFITVTTNAYVGPNTTGAPSEPNNNPLTTSTGLLIVANQRPFFYPCRWPLSIIGTSGTASYLYLWGG